MKNELLINEVYNKIAIMLISDVEDNYRDELLKAYKEYLISCYSQRDFEQTKLEKYINAIIELETMKWEKQPPNAKLANLLKDEALKKIQEISNQGYDYAISKLQNIIENDKRQLNVIEKRYADENIMQLNSLLPRVREFNRGLATSLVSEGILDFEYASSDSDITSLRIGRLR